MINGSAFKSLVKLLKGPRSHLSFNSAKSPLVSPEERSNYHTDVYGNNTEVNPGADMENRRAAGMSNPDVPEPSTNVYPNIRQVDNAMQIQKALGAEDNKPGNQQFNHLTKLLRKGK